MLVDAFGRVASDLRVSVTDKCDLRCTYCMPEEGLSWTPGDELLTFDEIERVVRVLRIEGVNKVRLTGGEPLLRRDLPDLIARIDRLGIEDISMTTNGTMLERHAEALKDAGLSRVNVSLDSLHADKFVLITRRDRFERVMAGLVAAHEAGLEPVKINCVVMRDVNEDEVPAFAELARVTGYDVRFIEYLPLDAQDQWEFDKVVKSDELRQAINELYPLVERNDTGPAKVYGFADGSKGSIGFIASISEPFCSSCDRIRLTSDGQFRSCLFSSSELDLRTMIRTGASDTDLITAIKHDLDSKQQGHGIGTAAFVKPKRPMSAIGG